MRRGVRVGWIRFCCRGMFESRLDEGEDFGWVSCCGVFDTS